MDIFQIFLLKNIVLFCPFIIANGFQGFEIQILYFLLLYSVECDSRNASIKLIELFMLKICYLDNSRYQLAKLCVS